MKLTLFFVLPLFFLKCGDKPKETVEIINNEPIEIVEEMPTVIEKPVLPLGAVVANYEAAVLPFYAFVKKVDKNKGITTIGFEKSTIPDIVIKESYAATLQSLRIETFNNDLLLVTTKLKDPIFNKYYLYCYKNGTWSQVVNAFSIHKDNNNKDLTPIQLDPNNSKNMLRYYSVFDLDETSSAGYTWRLLSESIPINK